MQHYYLQYGFGNVRTTIKLLTPGKWDGTDVLRLMRMRRGTLYNINFGWYTCTNCRIDGTFFSFKCNIGID